MQHYKLHGGGNDMATHQQVQPKEPTICMGIAEWLIFN
jgi:hypothetical protein